MNSVILADDHPLLLRGLCDLLGVEDDFRIVGATSGGKEALSAIRSLKPAMAVLDVAMPDLSGLEVLKAVRADRIELKVIFLTATITGPQIADALCLGVNGILLKESAPEGLINCMRQVSEGKNWLPPEILTNVRPESDEIAMLSKLSRREKRGCCSRVQRPVEQIHCPEAGDD